MKFDSNHQSCFDVTTFREKNVKEMASFYADVDKIVHLCRFYMKETENDIAWKRQELKEFVKVFHNLLRIITNFNCCIA